jgi:hypothetical protein
MMTMLDDLRLALRQICGAMGLSGNAATVVSLVVLGLALNAVALNAAESMRTRKHPSQGTVALRRAARTELKVVRTVVVSTLKKIGGGERGWCFAEQRETDQMPGSTKYGVGIVRAALTGGTDCYAMSA